MSFNVLRILQLIDLLWERPRKIEFLTNYFDVSYRTIYRDLKSLEDAGLPVDKDLNNRYFIVRGEYDSPFKYIY